MKHNFLRLLNFPDENELAIKYLYILQKVIHIYITYYTILIGDQIKIPLTV